MAERPRILAFAGSTRSGSFNKMLLKTGATGATQAGADVTLIDLRDFALPIYDGDLEATGGLPESAKKLKQLFLTHQGLLISSPEYNSSISGVLKNAIDWVSRSEPGEATLACYAGKVAALMSASPGALGGLRSLVTVRSILSNIKVVVLPEQFSLPKANEAFNADGSLKDAKQRSSAEDLGAGLARFLIQLNKP